MLFAKMFLFHSWQPFLFWWLSHSGYAPRRSRAERHRWRCEVAARRYHYQCFAWRAQRIPAS